MSVNVSCEARQTLLLQQWPAVFNLISEIEVNEHLLIPVLMYGDTVHTATANLLYSDVHRVIEAEQGVLDFKQLPAVGKETAAFLHWARQATSQRKQQAVPFLGILVKSISPAVTLTAVASRFYNENLDKSARTRPCKSCF